MADNNVLFTNRGSITPSPQAISWLLLHSSSLGCLWCSPFYKTGFIFLSGGGGAVVFLGSRRLGAHRPRHLIFTLFQSNVYKVNVSLPPCRFMSWKRTTFDVMMVWHEVLTDVKWRQSFNEDVFEASILRFFIVPYKRCYDGYLLGFSKTWLQISLCLWLECVCVHPLI